jgi:hypothetical protein
MHLNPSARSFHISQKAVSFPRVFGYIPMGIK